MLHYHHCPTCYEKKSCEMNCTIEPDLGDPNEPDRIFGSHCTCDDCQKETTFYTPEWWDKYNGIKKRK